MKLNFDQIKHELKKESKTIIIAVVSIILVITIVIFAMYKLMGTKTDINNEYNHDIPDFTKGYGVTINNTVTFHIFHSTTCPHCKAAIKFLESIKNDYDYLEIKTYDVSKGDNAALMQKVATKLDKGKITGVPFIVIGNEYTLNGYSEKRDDELKAEIKKAYENTSYIDTVEEVITENPDLKAEITEIKK